MKEILINKNGLAISEISNVTNNGNSVSFETKLLDNNANVKFDIYDNIHYGDWDANIPSSAYDSTLPYEEIFDQKQIMYSYVDEGGSTTVKYYFELSNSGPSFYVIMTSLDGIEFTSEDFNKILYNVAIIADDDVMGDGSKLVSSLVAWPTSGPIHRVAIGAANTTFNANSIKVVDRTDDMSQVDLYGENGDIVHSMVFSAESNTKGDSVHLTYDEMEGTDIYYDTFIDDNGQTMYNYYASKTNYNRMYHVTITTSEDYTQYDEYYERYGISELLMNFKCIATTSDENQGPNEYMEQEIVFDNSPIEEVRFGPELNPGEISLSDSNESRVYFSLTLFNELWPVYFEMWVDESLYINVQNSFGETVNDYGAINGSNVKHVLEGDSINHYFWNVYNEAEQRYVYVHIFAEIGREYSIEEIEEIINNMDISLAMMM